MIKKLIYFFTIRQAALVACLMVFILGQAQHNNNWALGLKGGITFGTKQISKIKTSICRGLQNSDSNLNAMTSLSFSNCKGELVVYGSEGQLWNKNHQPFKNGIINGLFAQIVPKPGTDRYLYCVNNSSFATPVYTLIDLMGDNGLGEVVQKDIPIDSLFSRDNAQVFTITKHANGKDFWIICAKSVSVTYAYLLSNSGFSKTPVVSNGVFCYGISKINQHQSSFYSGAINLTGQFKMTHDGKQLIATGIDSSLTKEGCSFIYDFDNSTGKISNRRVLLKFEDISGFYPNTAFSFGNYLSCEVSPNDSQIYLLSWVNAAAYPYSWSSTISQINRYNLSKKVFKKYNYALLGLQMGPDAKMYSLKYEYPATISCFTKPNNQLSKSEFKQLLTDYSFQCLSFPVSYQPFYKLYYSSNIDSDPCADTARFDVHVDESFRAFKVFFGDGDSLAFNPPLAKSYKLKHVYKTPGTYYFEVRGLSPTCDYYNRSGDSVTVYNAPSRIKTSNVVKPGCDLSKLQLTDSLQNTRFAYYQWQASLNDTVIIPYGQNAYSIAHQKIYSTPSVKEILKLELRNQYCPNSVVYNDTFYPVFYPKLELNYKIEGVSTILTRDTLKSKIRYSACAPLKFIYSDSSESIIKASLSYNSIDVSKNTAFAIPVMLNSGEYAFYVNDTNTNACAASDTFYVRAYERPMANFQLNDTAQCFAGNEFQVQLVQSDSSNTNTFYWMANDSVALKPNISVLHAYAKPGTYAIRLKVKNSENCYSIKDSIIQVYQQPNAEFVLNRSALCLKDNLFVFTPSGQGQHAWDFGDIQTSDSSIVQHHFNRTGQYTIQHTIKTNIICTDTVRKNVNVWEMPIAGILTSDTLKCLENNLISLKSSSIYSQIDSLQQILYWGDGASVNFSNNSILTHQYLQKGKYTQRLVVQTKHLCKDSISSFVQIADMPKLTILKDGFCLGETSVLKALVNNGVAVKTYNWIVQGKQESSKLDSIHHGFSAAGTYKVKVEGMSDAQCLGVDSTVIEILEKPQSIFTYILGGNGKLNFKFNNQSFNANKWNWDFAGQGNSLIKNPEFKFTDTGMLNICLIASNQDICYDTACQLIPIYNQFEFYFPNVLSADGNGINDCFGLHPTQYNFVNTYQMRIYNRWGEKVFDSYVKEETWNPTKAVQGIYIYRCVIRDAYNVLHDLKGVVEVLR